MTTTPKIIERAEADAAKRAEAMRKILARIAEHRARREVQIFDIESNLKELESDR